MAEIAKEYIVGTKGKGRGNVYSVYEWKGEKIQKWTCRRLTGLPGSGIFWESEKRFLS